MSLHILRGLDQHSDASMKMALLMKAMPYVPYAYQMIRVRVHTCVLSWVFHAPICALLLSCAAGESRGRGGRSGEHCFPPNPSQCLVSNLQTYVDDSIFPRSAFQSLPPCDSRASFS
jgi:hypothetical protein